VVRPIYGSLSAKGLNGGCVRIKIKIIAVLFVSPFCVYIFKFMEITIDTKKPSNTT
jgi:hypothetical protein